LGYAKACAALPGEPQVLITMASRFQRLSWKYSSMAYATTLKNVGVLYQTMYLVATAMGLAPCGLGGGDSDLFAQAAGTNYFAESSVGEVLLGTVGRPASSSGSTVEPHDDWRLTVVGPSDALSPTSQPSDLVQGSEAGLDTS
jgi:hypothetical protein